ncbi:LysE family translocator [Candidatus Pantoea deserta]|uniref:LysE family translocator n=2 Tax=Candidatus Pantoea deserta TaxID=1869313 RepID=A0A3N4NIE7_9GAMM|nr:LysE family translocator [Pantoea deserta]
MMLILARGISQGRKTALLVVIGVTVVSGVFQILLLALGLATLIKSHPIFLTLLRFTGAAYLGYIGLKMLWTSIGKKVSLLNSTEISPFSAVKEGLINNFTNPKVMLFMFAFLPQFVNNSYGHVMYQLAVLGTIQKTLALIILSIIALASDAIGKIFNKYPVALIWQQRLTGFIMFALALRLILMGNPS